MQNFSYFYVIHIPISCAGHLPFICSNAIYFFRILSSIILLLVLLTFLPFCLFVTVLFSDQIAKFGCLWHECPNSQQPTDGQEGISGHPTSRSALIGTSLLPTIWFFERRFGIDMTHSSHRS